MENQNINEQVNYLEDEIDLREVVLSIIKYKAMIFSITAFITICAAVFAFSKTPVYEAKATVEIGNINNALTPVYEAKETVRIGNINIGLLEDSHMMQKRLQHIFSNKSYATQYPKIVKIVAVKRTKNLVEITSESTDTQSAVEKLNELVANIINEHGKKINHYLFSMENRINLLKKQIDELIKQKENLEKENISQQIKIDAILKDNAAVAAVYTIELNGKFERVLETKNKIFELSNRLNDFELEISPENIKNTHLLGKIIKNQFPVKPKKKLIIGLGFVAGLFLSLFLVFFVECIKKSKHKTM